MSTADDPRRSTRERVLDAAEACLRRDGIRKTSALQVAAEAGVSRAWLYRLFPDKATLLSAALIRRDEAFWVDAQHQVDDADGFAAKIAAAVSLSRAAPLGPLATELRDNEPEAFAEVIGTYVEDIIPGMSWFWQHQLEQAVASGELRPDLDLEAAAEWVMRLVVSFVSVPSVSVDIDDRDSLEKAFTTFLMPALVLSV
ncbi:putative transcriptional regulator, TetR family protein [Nocardioides szechwanensis]|uniref:Transcriptional regulator, TetR family n=1 Tax=Nocardioides szechwanensis TaxID=1005944 RepID=A0A1H0J6F5_9ACTN|nr:TetR/AcrR family transcriptional regulator [Nocardioides szechwanensis]GEP35017.1 putative transcriptional regulator, TetR family protein [Nocardioides szechwanensis]SDO39103.1 transcriptional regulator, TetR family [Nocardioides szechwanensis]